jgi:hypothetical protein
LGRGFGFVEVFAVRIESLTHPTLEISVNILSMTYASLKTLAGDIEQLTIISDTYVCICTYCGYIFENISR